MGLDIEFQGECESCGADLDLTIKDKRPGVRYGADIILIVEPCKACMNSEKEAGIEEGKGQS